MKTFNSLTISATGKQVTSGAASANTTLPNDSSGNKARYVALTCPSGAVYVRLGADNTVAATANDMVVSASQPPLILACQQFDYIAYLQVNTGDKLNIVPVEG